MNEFFASPERLLYHKIKFQEELTTSLAEKALEEGWIVPEGVYTVTLPEFEAIEKESGEKHRLNFMINDAETRYAALVRDITAKAPDRLVKLFSQAFAFGQQHLLPSDIDPLGAFQEFENTFLNGMPEDRVDKLVFHSEKIAIWEQTKEVHASYWIEAGNDSEIYYRLRNCVMDGMLSSTPMQTLMREGKFMIAYR